MIFINKATILAIFAFGVSSTAADSSERSLDIMPFLCSDALDCRECIENDCSWALGSCMDSCGMLADVSCFHKSSYPNKTSYDICRIDWIEDRNWEICAPGFDCESCTSTSLYNPADGNCWWHAETNSCQPVANDMISQGRDTCCSQAAPGCGNCLEAGCQWAAGNCIDSCMMIADAACYGQENFPGESIRDICQKVAVEDVDNNICSEQSSCNSCTNTLQFDGYTKCHWYTHDGVGWCGTGNCDMNGNCGSTECPHRVLKGNTRGVSQPDQGIKSFFQAMFEP